MKRYKPFHFCFLIFLLFLTACTSSVEVPQEKPDLDASPIEIASAKEESINPWQIVRQLDLEFLPSYVAFLNEDVGVTNCGRVNSVPSFTENGGESWVQAELKLYCSSTIEIVNSESAFMCHGDMGFKMSKDGGETLEHLTLPVGGDCELLSFLNEGYGWGASDRVLSVTEDGANSWTEIPLPEKVGRIAAIFLRTPEAGYLLDFDGILYQTQDGGISWVSQTLDLGDDKLEMMSFGRPSAVVNFLDEKNGLVVLNLAGGGASEVVALHTIDGGEIWERHVLPVELGPLNLSHDGQYLTVLDMNTKDKAILLKR